MPKPKAAEPKPLLGFVKNEGLRRPLETFVAALPGAAVLGICIFLTGLFNIYKNLSEPGNAFVIAYIPIICLLPAVVGALGPLILERVRAVHATPIKPSILAAAISGLLGSLIGASVLFFTGLALSDLKPFGVAIDSNVLAQVIFSLAIVFLSTALSVIGGALMCVILARSER